MPQPNHTQSATQVFFRARRRARLERFLARLKRVPAGLLCYQEIRERLGMQAAHDLGVREIPLKAIIGSVGRCSDYTRMFLPLKDSDRRRWTGIMKAITESRPLPPIRVYRVGEVFFVADGHHRTSVALQQGLTHMGVQVVDIQTRLPLVLPTVLNPSPAHRQTASRRLVRRTHDTPSGRPSDLDH